MLSGSINIRWAGDAFARGVRGEVNDRLERAARLVRKTARDLISEPYPPASMPGEPPHKRTGELKKHVIFSVDKGKLVAIVGSNLSQDGFTKYGLFLELGTRRMKARPWLRVALQQCLPEIQQMFGQTLTGSSAVFRGISWVSLWNYYSRSGSGP